MKIFIICFACMSVGAIIGYFVGVLVTLESFREIMEDLENNVKRD